MKDLLIYINKNGDMFISDNYWESMGDTWCCKQDSIIYTNCDVMNYDIDYGADSPKEYILDSAVDDDFYIDTGAIDIEYRKECFIKLFSLLSA